MLATLSRARSLRHISKLSVRTLTSNSSTSSQTTDTTPHKHTFVCDKLRDKANHEFKKAQSRVFTVPNILTFSRIATTPAIGYFIWTGSQTQAIACFAFAATTDLLDGFIARRFNQQSDIGVMLDPIADKFLMITCFVALYNASLMPLWCVKTFIMRDAILLISGATLRYYGFSERPSKEKFFDFKNYPTVGFEPTLLSKCNTALQCMIVLVHLTTSQMVGSPLYDWSVFSLQLVTCITSVLSLSQYATRVALPSSMFRPPRSRG